MEGEGAEREGRRGRAVSPRDSCRDIGATVSFRSRCRKAQKEGNEGELEIHQGNCRDIIVTTEQPGRKNMHKKRRNPFIVFPSDGGF